MANYPNAVTTFTTKVDGAGNKVQAAHINAMQDEITAIEDGLLNGTAPVNSSRITATSVQVSGNSTVAGNMTVGGSLTVTGALSLSDLTVTAAPPAARVSASANQNVNSGSATALAFNTQVFTSTSGMHSTATNNTRLVAVSSGIYHIYGGAAFQASSAGSIRVLQLRIDGSSIVAYEQRHPVQGGNQTIATVDTLYRFASSGSYAELVVQHDVGSAIVVVGGQDYTPYLGMVRVR